MTVLLNIAFWGTFFAAIYIYILSRLAASEVFLKNLAQLHPSFAAKKSKMSQVPKQSLSLFNWFTSLDSTQTNISLCCPP